MVNSVTTATPNAYHFYDVALVLWHIERNGCFIKVTTHIIFVLRGLLSIILLSQHYFLLLFFIFLPRQNFIAPYSLGSLSDSIKPSGFIE